MKLHIDAVNQNLNQVRSMSVTTAPNNVGQFVELQIAEQLDGSLIVVVAGEPSTELTKDPRGFGHLRVWPTAKP
jgi:nitrate reductase NapAB chaperone NapD